MHSGSEVRVELAEEVAGGRMIRTGRQESGTGGILITGDISTEDAEQLMAADPHPVAGVVRYDRVGFTAGVRAPRPVGLPRRD